MEQSRFRVLQTVAFDGADQFMKMAAQRGEDSQREFGVHPHPRLSVHFRYSKPTETDRAAGFFHSTGLIDANLIESMLPSKDCDYYFCGPKPFMVAIYRQLVAWGIPGSQVNFEFFGPREALTQAGLSRPSRALGPGG